MQDIEPTIEVICFRCKRKPEQIDEYVQIAAEEGMTPTQYVLQEEGTLNRESMQFCCTSCYVEIGMPSSRRGWKAP